MPAITIATPTWRREALLRLQLENVLAQSEQDFEWLILDDSPEPSAYFRGVSDPRVLYHHHAGPRLSIGAKRNWLAERARGAMIAHFDDDDYYAPDYLATMGARIAAGADFVKLSGWFVYSALHARLGWWDTARTPGLHFRFSQKDIRPVVFSDAEAVPIGDQYLLGYGFNYFYRKSVWEAARFPDRNGAEDYAFARAAIAGGFRLEHFADEGGLCLHVLRADNMSVCLPQYILPDFMLARLFPQATRNFLKP